MKKLYAYLIKYNSKSDNPSYDVRYYEKEHGWDNGDTYQWIRCAMLDVEVPEEKCKCCGKVKS